jgi:deoxyribodipyrimidine photo-lyase
MLQVVWFKRDLRLLDHAPIHRASEAGEVLPIYVAEPSVWHNGDLVKRHFNFALESLRDTQQALRRIGGELYVTISEIEDVLEAIFAIYGPFHLQSHMEHGIQPTYERDKRVKKWIVNHNCIWTQHTGFAVIRRGIAPSRKVLFQEWLKQPIYQIPKRMQLPQTIPDLLTNHLEILDKFDVSGEDAPKRAKGGESEAIAYAKQFFAEKYKRYNIYINKPFYSPSSSSLLAPLYFMGECVTKISTNCYGAPS